MSAEKRIVIQHTDGKFYDYKKYDDTITFNEKFEEVNPYPAKTEFCPNRSTDDIDFSIGSRVYFHGIGWTEVFEEIDHCDGCVLDLSGKCYLECDKRIFKKLSAKEYKPDVKYYVISLAFGYVSDEYATEKEAREECERKAKAEPNVTFSVMKVIDSCCAESVVKWYEK